MRPTDRDGDPADPSLGHGEGPRMTASGTRAHPSPGRDLLILTQEQVAALRTVLEGYRASAFRQLLPTTERNERLRQTQALLGWLHALAPPPGGECWLNLAPDELDGLRQVLQVVREQPTLRDRWRREFQLLAPLFGWSTSLP
ncbi:hypothetical protein [Thermogemmatispora tikiterensis]|uniref:Uncharacterized protein n=1 Tax=Thermogemmatispora tikiterensis TaxID=1825093 RepID=A0A328VFJ5_9CHLR|nr:hypothetical protein [Thermogemmatispora tikiterensis]RAQ94313.1 hypothetical protein A4R35_02135 [Thermogemmatispora tikiterensis]